MSITDIFKKSFLDGYSSADINIYTASAAMLVACCMGLYIFVVYRVLTRKTFYSKTFNISLAAITVITTAVIITIQSSIVVSLGMVGALSIVRFRTAVKDPMDLAFLFWAIVAGIICGVGMAEIAIIMSLLLTVGIVVLDKLPVAKAPMILVVNASDPDAEKKDHGCSGKAYRPQHCEIPEHDRKYAGPDRGTADLGRQRIIERYFAGRRRHVCFHAVP